MDLTADTPSEPPSDGLGARFLQLIGIDAPVAENFDSRHRLTAGTLAALGPFLLLVGIVRSGISIHLLTEIICFVALPLTGALVPDSKRAKALYASFGLMFAAALFVHLSGGIIEAHFSFFVLLPLIALYRDRLAFIGAVAFVLGHHAVMGTIAPLEVFANPAAQQRPVLWAFIHAAFVSALVIVLVMHWRASEAEQRRLEAALDELRRTQVRLVQAQKLESLGELAAGVAHEINTPIQFIGDNVRFLQDSFTDLITIIEHRSDCTSAAPPDDLEDLDYLTGEIPTAIDQSLDGLGRVADIVRALKGVSHPSMSEWRSTDINQLLRDAMTVSRNEWKYAADVRLELAAELPMVRCAPGPLGQVFLNMIVNGAHAIEARFGETDSPQGVITLRTSSHDGEVHIVIEDNGCGMSAAVAGRIFDPFFTTKDVGKGSGQGLSISHAVICEQLAGSIDVSTRPGDGARFTLTVPIGRHDLLDA